MLACYDLQGEAPGQGGKAAHHPRSASFITLSIAAWYGAMATLVTASSFSTAVTR